MRILPDYNIYISSFIIASFSILLHYLLRRWLQKIINALEENGHPSTGMNFMKNSLGLLVYGIGLALIIYQIPQLKSLGTSMLAGAGIFAAVIGFASQAAFSNIISGLFIVIFKPFQIDDTIELSSNLKGVVTDITFRHTVIKDFENRRIIIPNSKIGEDTIINSSLDEEAIRKRIDFLIGYDSDEDKAKKIIQEVLGNHPLCLDQRSDDDKKNNEPIIPVLMVAWEDSSIRLRAYAWTNNNADAFTLQCDALDTVKKRFKQEGISIPYQQVVIHQAKES